MLRPCRTAPIRSPKSPSGDSRPGLWEAHPCRWSILARGYRSLPPTTKLNKMIDAADEDFMRRLQFLARSLRRRNEPAIADDLEAVIRLTKCAREEREEAVWRDPWHLSLIRRLENRAEQARTENQSLIASDLDAVVELIRRLRALG